MVQPLHLQDNLSKFPILQKIHESARVAPEVEREVFNRELIQQQRDKVEKTQDSQETEKPTIREKEREKQRKPKQQKRELKPKAEEEPEESGYERNGKKSSAGQHVDILI
jgi:hypothetical protein